METPVDNCVNVFIIILISNDFLLKGNEEYEKT